ncbi:MAG: hypothetical protein A2494_01750 [Candidatus Lloydbacteria bacterium RIFOXYC12_FULL_46_25]|uniref:Lipid II flippase MurJ n=1 Tax=Candidatus Lloydbacteria bacterium RIFOXYC12_FULL_46_25 TaxID=1798670 RepID=A0A1G2E0U1_9BACT|nr:MAG: hypothetical protein A2494_01750 [Candidatus Lloydbacteria bacterium RIFOXYC12_FULL_46_25]
MVERLLRVLHREWNGLHEAAFLLAGTALLSQLLGLFRDRLLADHFGASESLDVYYAAFRIPDLLYVSVASFVAVTVLIPFLLERMDSPDGKESARKFIDSIFSVFIVSMLMVCGLAYMLIPYLTEVFVPGFSSAAKEEYITLARLLLLSPLLLGISNLFGSITQSFRRFFVFAAGPVLYNVGIILGIVLWMPLYGLSGVVWGVLLGALLHVLIQFPVLRRERIVPRLTGSIDWKIVRGVVRLSIPRTIALSAMHISTIILIALASQIASGSIAVFTLAMNLQSIPLAIIGMSYSVAAFPTLAKLWTGGNHKDFLEQIVTATRHIMFWSFPAIVLFIVLRAQIVRTILGSGAFDWTATRLTAAALALFAISVVAQSLVLLFTRSFYAMGKTRLPLIANMMGAVFVVVFSLTLYSLYNTHAVFRYFIETLLRVPDISGTSVLMLPLGYSLGMIGNVLMLFYFLMREFPNIIHDIKRPFLHAFTTSVVIGFITYHGLQLLAPLFPRDTFLGIFAQGFFAGMIGIVGGIFLLRLMENQELREIQMSLHRKFWKSKPIATEPEGV